MSLGVLLLVLGALPAGLFLRVVIRSLNDNARYAFTAADRAAARAAIRRPQTTEHIHLESPPPPLPGTLWYLCRADEQEPTGFVEHYGWARNSVAATRAAHRAGRKGANPAA
ncbi:hypothetical protein AB0D67_38275 [Streptosporangium sp. NPDC048047]|uniref:hypothetical protein n=1 Tax=Streptosporangium sp. NPDC048047 TaxID=3155748 RepID=UPI003427C88D